MTSHIIIPHYNKWELTHARLWELYKKCLSDDLHVLVVDDNSTDSMTDGGIEWWKEFGKDHSYNLEFIHTPNNLNFLLACNFGITHILENAHTKDDLLVLLSNDVEIKYNVITHMRTELDSNQKSLIGGILLSQDTGWNRFGDRLFPYIEGWLLGTSIENWIELGGGFDTRFSPSDYEDIDLSTNARSLGYELVPLNSPALRHLGAQTIGYNEERLVRTNENKKKFEEKWITHIT